MTGLDIAAIRALAEISAPPLHNLHMGYADALSTATRELIPALCDRITELERINAQLAEALAAERKVKEQMP